MKKILLLSTVTLGLAGGAMAQSSSFYKTSYKARNSGSFNKGANLLSLTYGFPAAFAHDNSGFGPFYAKFEHGIMPEVGLGFQLGLGSSSYHIGQGYKINEFGFGFAALGYYHFNKLIPVKELDVYAGVGIAFLNVARNSNSPYNPKNSFNVNPAWKVGARWYFTPTFAVNADFGYDQMSSANLGVTFRF